MSNQNENQPRRETVKLGDGMEIEIKNFHDSVFITINHDKSSLEAILHPATKSISANLYSSNIYDESCMCTPDNQRLASKTLIVEETTYVTTRVFSNSLTKPEWGYKVAKALKKNIIKVTED